MAMYATNRFPGDGTTTSYEFNFVGKYIARTHVKVYQEDNATKVRTYVSINDSNFLNDTTLRSLPVTPVGSTLVIYRDTPKPPIVDFVNGSRFTEYNMDLVARQGLFVAMEAMDAGDAEARQQLLDAIAVVGGLVDDATAAVSDATAAALAAATSAANSAGSATIAQDAKVAAEAANSAAQAARSGAQSSAAAASTSASNAASSASTASTQAGAASGHATAAASSASAAAASATAADSRATAAVNAASSAAISAGSATTSASNASAYAAQAAASAASINASNFVTVGTAQTVSGLKTFTESPNVGNLANLELAAGRALNWQSTKPRVVVNGWGIQAGVSNSVVYMGWGGFPDGIKAQVDATPMGSVITTNAASNPNTVGSLIFAHYVETGVSIGYGQLVPGAGLRATSGANFAGAGLPGTWVCLGAAVGNAASAATTAKTLFMRFA